MLRHLSIALALLALLGTAALAGNSLTTTPGWTNPGISNDPSTAKPVVGDRTITWWTVQAVFDTAYPGLTFEDWHGSLASGILGCTGPANSTTSNECYLPGDIVPGINYWNLDPANVPGLAYVQAGTFGGHGDLLVPNFFVDGGYFEFNPPICALGIVWSNHYAGGLPIHMEVFNGNTLLGSADVNGGTVFFTGISTDGTLITKVTFLGEGSHLEGIDDVEFGACTTPTENSNFSTVKSLY